MPIAMGLFALNDYKKAEIIGFFSSKSKTNYSNLSLVSLNTTFVLEAVFLQQTQFFKYLLSKEINFKQDYTIELDFELSDTKQVIPCTIKNASLIDLAIILGNPAILKNLLANFEINALRTILDKNRHMYIYSEIFSATMNTLQLAKNFSDPLYRGHPNYMLYIVAAYVKILDPTIGYELDQVIRYPQSWFYCLNAKPNDSDRLLSNILQPASEAHDIESFQTWEKASNFKEYIDDAKDHAPEWRKLRCRL